MKSYRNYDQVIGNSTKEKVLKNLSESVYNEGVIFARLVNDSEYFQQQGIIAFEKTEEKDGFIAQAGFLCFPDGSISSGYTEYNNNHLLVYIKQTDNTWDSEFIYMPNVIKELELLALQNALINAS